jgi:hypothetical protein
VTLRDTMASTGLQFLEPASRRTNCLTDTCRPVPPFHLLLKASIALQLSFFSAGLLESPALQLCWRRMRNVPLQLNHASRGNPGTCLQQNVTGD